MPFLFAAARLSSPMPGLALQHASGSQEGYVWMFVLMAATPYLLLLIIGGGIMRARRRQREEEVERALLEQRDWEAEHTSLEGRT